MADPFRTDAKSQLLREARMGLSVVAVLLVILVYVAVYRITGRGRQIPEHVLNAPVASTVWPDAIPPSEQAQLIAAQQNAEKETARLSNGLIPQSQTVDRQQRPLPDRAVNGFAESSFPKSGASTTIHPNSQQTKSKPATPDSDLVTQTQTVNSFAGFNSSDQRQASSIPRPVTPIRNDAPLAREEHLPKKSAREQTNGFPIPNPSPSPTADSQSKGTEAVRQGLGVAKAAFDNEIRSSKPVTSEEPSPLDNQAVKSTNRFPIPQTRSSLPTAELSNTRPKLPSLKPDEEVKQAHVEVPERAPQNEFLPPPPARSTGRALLPPAPGFTQAPQPDTGSDADQPMKSVLNQELDQTPAVRMPTANPDEEIQPDSTNTHHPRPKLIPSKPVPATADFSSAKRLRKHNNQSEKSEGDESKTGDESNPDGSNPDGRGATVSTTARTEDWGDAPQSTARSYITREGDSFWSIAEEVYGDGRLFRALYKYNEPTFPKFDSLPSGSSVGTPTRRDLIRLFPGFCPPDVSGQSTDNKPADTTPSSQVYVTREGDTLFEIARQRLGQASRYLEIKESNSLRLDSQVHHLTPLKAGVRLVLPFDSLN